MKKELKDWFVPWLFTSREYNVGILDQAMANPDYARLMLNENPISLRRRSSRRWLNPCDTATGIRTVF